MDAAVAAVVDALPEASAGGQLHLSVGGASTDLTFGEAVVGEPLTGDHLFNVYCAAKPIAVMATLATLETAGVASEPDAPLHDLLPVPSSSPFGALTLGDLVGHRTGLAAPDVFKFLTSPDLARAQMLERLDRSLARRRRKAEHSTLGLSYVLTVLLRRLGTSLEEAMATHLHAAGIAGPLVRVPADGPPLGVFVDRSRGRYVPMLHERVPYYCDSPYSELVGIYASAAQLGRWGRELLAVLGGEERPGFPRAATVAAHRAVAAELEGPAYAAGLAVRLGEHGLTRAPATALGQFGFVRSSLLYVDPAHDTVLVGIVADLLIDDLDRRLRQWDEAIGGVVAATGSPVPAAPEAG